MSGAAVPAAGRLSLSVRPVIADKRGVTAVEFALVSLALLTWMFGMMETARAYWDYQIIEEVAIEGARCMGVVATGCASGGAYNSSATTTFIENLAQSRGLTLSSSDLTLTRPTSCAGTSGFSQLTITYDFKTNLPVLLPSLKTIALSTTACYYNVS
jgi:Flp pilus assembly protein TadG